MSFRVPPWGAGLGLAALLACPSTDERSRPRGGAVVSDDKADTRFMRIRRLLSRPPESRERATKLYGLVRPLCTDASAQADFLETAQWSAGFGHRKNYLPIRLTLDVLEHVASVCTRTSSEGTLALLRGAEAFLGEEPRLHVLKARTLALADRTEEAGGAAREAVRLGSAHAIALLANIEARRARGTRTSYAPGMLDEAIATTDVEPSPDWHAIDLSAILATRARLLLERALWTDGEIAQTSRDAAAKALFRLVDGPFPRHVRSRAVDALCFEAVDRGLRSAWAQASEEGDVCARAGREYGHLGAAVIARADDAPIEPRRRAALAELSARLTRLEAGALVLVVFRGDETELREWGRPAAYLLGALAKQGADLLFVDRSSSERAAVLARRVFRLAGIKTPWARIDGRQGTLTMPCVAALLADRRTPKSCPLEPEMVDRLVAREPPVAGLLIGRDLDAEIDDLNLYGHRTVLLSFRKTELEKEGPKAWLKSLSDVLIVAGSSSP